MERFELRENKRIYAIMGTTGNLYKDTKQWKELKVGNLLCGFNGEYLQIVKKNDRSIIIKRVNLDGQMVGLKEEKMMEPDRYFCTGPPILYNVLVW